MEATPATKAASGEKSHSSLTKSALISKYLSKDEQNSSESNDENTKPPNKSYSVPKISRVATRNSKSAEDNYVPDKKWKSNVMNSIFGGAKPEEIKEEDGEESKKPSQKATKSKGSRKNKKKGSDDEADDTKNLFSFGFSKKSSPDSKNGKSSGLSEGDWHFEK